MSSLKKKKITLWFISSEQSLWLSISSSLLSDFPPILLALLLRRKYAYSNRSIEPYSNIINQTSFKCRRSISDIGKQTNFHDDSCSAMRRDRHLLGEARNHAKRSDLLSRRSFTRIRSATRYPLSLSPIRHPSRAPRPAPLADEDVVAAVGDRERAIILRGTTPGVPPSPAPRPTIPGAAAVSARFIWKLLAISPVPPARECRGLRKGTS